MGIKFLDAACIQQWLAAAAAAAACETARDGDIYFRNI